MMINVHLPHRARLTSKRSQQKTLKLIKRSRQLKE